MFYNDQNNILLDILNLFQLIFFKLDKLFNFSLMSHMLVKILFYNFSWSIIIKYIFEIQTIKIQIMIMQIINQ